jgi:hypothetical protein
VGSHEVLSLVELTRRLSEVRRGEEHLKTRLPRDSEHNRILRLADIVAYTGIPYPWLRRQFPEMYRFEFPDAPRPKPKGHEKPSDKTEIAARQTLLSRFFYGWDQGTLIKARIGNEWTIIGRHSDEVSLGPAPRQEAPAGKMISMRIDRATLGLRFK